jgi:hypothetical protein
VSGCCVCSLVRTFSLSSVVIGGEVCGDNYLLLCVCSCVCVSVCLCCNCVWFGWLYAHIADGIIKL